MQEDDRTTRRPPPDLERTFGEVQNLLSGVGGWRLVSGDAHNRNPEFYALSRTREAYKDGQNKSAVMILTTDSDYYRYLKKAGRPISGPARAAR